MSGKKFLNKNVYEASLERIHYIFQNFDNIQISFSSGKDSGVLLNLVKEVAKFYKNKYISIIFVDLEAIYQKMVDYAFYEYNLIKKIKDDNNWKFYWICLPLTLKNSISVFEPFFICWDENKKDKWIHDIPNFAINKNNHDFEFYNKNINFIEFMKNFSNWLAKKNNSKVASLIGIRTQESIHRWNAIKGKYKKNIYQNISWSTKINDNLINFYPIYDWQFEDIWKYYSQFNIKYNEIYNFFYLKGIEYEKMRVCYAFGYKQREGLFLYHELESETYNKIINRVNGVGFYNLYHDENIVGFKNNYIKPKNLNWEEYVNFIIKTLPKISANKYLKKINSFNDKKDEFFYKNIALMILKNDFQGKTISKGQLEFKKNKAKKLKEKWKDEI